MTIRNCSKLDVLSSQLASRLFRRNAAVAIAPRPSSSSSSSPSTPSSPPFHDLTLYEYEASPWCRLVREQLTILDLNVHIRPCPRESILRQGAYRKSSRFRPEAHQALVQSLDQEQEREHKNNNGLNLRFPILVDNTYPHQRIILQESYQIIQHLWETYGQDVLFSGKSNKRPDQIVNSSKLPFPIRFFLLAGPSYLRCLPRCGLMRLPSKKFDHHHALTLYQAEGCPYSRLVREVLCSLELPYCSVSCAEGSGSRQDATLLQQDGGTKFELPVLVIEKKRDGNNQHHGYEDNNNDNPSKRQILVGYQDIISYLWEQYHDNESPQPSWYDHISDEEIWVKMVLSAWLLISPFCKDAEPLCHLSCRNETCSILHSSEIIIFVQFRS